MGLSLLRGLFKKKTELSDKEKFDGAMIVAHEIAEKNPHDLHSLIKIFARKIQYDYFSEFVKLAGIYPNDSKILKLNYQNLWINPYQIQDSGEASNWLSSEMEKLKKLDGEIELCLNSDIVWPWPWRKQRFVDCLTMIGKGRVAGEWKQDKMNHHAVSWEPLGVSFVEGGNHSITSGILKGEGRFTSEYVFDLRRIYERLSCDGEYYFYQGKRISRILEINFAIIFEIGRLLSEREISYWGLDKKLAEMKDN